MAIAGTTDGTSVTVTATAAGPATPVASGKPTPVPGAPPAPLHLTVGTDGAFTGTYQLPPGRWTLTVVATATGGQTTAVSRTVTVAIAGIVLTVEIKGGSAWLKVWVDGRVVPSYTGVTVRAGTRLQFTGSHTRRGPHGLVRGDLLHRERGRDRQPGRPRGAPDVALPAGQGTAEDDPHVTVGRPPTAEALVALARSVQAACLARGADPGHRRVVHGRPDQPHPDRGARVQRVLPGRRRELQRPRQGGPARRARGHPRALRRRVRAGGPGDGRSARVRASAPTSPWP